MSQNQIMISIKEESWEAVYSPLWTLLLKRHFIYGWEIVVMKLIFFCPLVSMSGSQLEFSPQKRRLIKMFSSKITLGMCTLPTAAASWPPGTPRSLEQPAQRQLLFCCSLSCLCSSPFRRSHPDKPWSTAKGRLWARLGPDVCSPWSQWSMEAVAESWWGCFHGHRTQHKLLMLEWIWGLLLHSKQHQHWSESDLVLVFTWSGFDPVLICTWTTPDLVMFSTCSCLDPSSLWGIDQEPVACWYINHHGHDCVRRQSKGHRNLTSIYWVFLWGRCWLC